MSELKNGAVYEIASNRKGTFQGRLLYHCDTWATFEITSGRASAMMSYNEREAGEKVTVRRSFCNFTEQQQEGGAA